MNVIKYIYVYKIVSPVPWIVLIVYQNIPKRLGKGCITILTGVISFKYDLECSVNINRSYVYMNMSTCVILYSAIFF